MTPEQERNHWILAGYPLMPEWIEFCRLWRDQSVSSEKAVEIWWEHVEATYPRSAKSISYYSRNLCSDTMQAVGFHIDGITYEWNLGEDHAE